MIKFDVLLGALVMFSCCLCFLCAIVCIDCCFFSQFNGCAMTCTLKVHAQYRRISITVQTQSYSCYVSILLINRMHGLLHLRLLLMCTSSKYFLDVLQLGMVVFTKIFLLMRFLQQLRLWFWLYNLL